jgi:phospholipase/carboxylesterase
MNRTRRSKNLALSAPVPPLFSVEAGRMETALGDTVHSLFAPLHYEPGYAYPLLVWLHGLHSDERHILRIMPLVSMQNYVAVAPRGLEVTAAEEGRSGCGWQQTDDHIRQAEQRVFDGIEIACGKLHVSPQRIFLAGFDCGGSMALRLAMSHPERFAGVLSLCGSLPMGGTLLANLAAVRRLPVFMAVGRYSPEYPQNRVCDDLRLLHSAGISVTLRQYPCSHELAPQMLLDVNRWMIEQITTPNDSRAKADSRRSFRLE